MADGNAQITIIIPVFNEAACLNRLGDELMGFFVQSPLPVRVLFVNDGSTDGGDDYLRALCRRQPDFTCLTFPANCGLSAALRAGIDSCHTPLVGYMDADLQTLPGDFLKLMPHADEYEMVNGIRQNRHDPMRKIISSRIANSIRKFVLKDGMDDTCCPLKIMQTGIARKIPYFSGMHRFLPALVQMQGGRVKQVPVRHFPRYAGQPKYHLHNRLVGPMIDMLMVSWLIRRNRAMEVVEPYHG
ncbi:MAG: glycosyltransferase family 2 protein [Desulfobacteraceae bacterium]|nr:glycosyltransferase family 2 protein [Desulfobacteraceae bacterium]